MIIIDTNILSTFSRIDQIFILFKLFPKEKLAITSAVYDEMIEAIISGFSFMEKAKSLIDTGSIQLITLNVDEVLAKQDLPTSFGSGELECVTICKHRSYILLTNDKRVRNYCKSENITVYDLPMLLRAIWENEILSKEKVRQLVIEIETKENMVIKNKDLIFKE